MRWLSLSVFLAASLSAAPNDDLSLPDPCKKKLPELASSTPRQPAFSQSPTLPRSPTTEEWAQTAASSSEAESQWKLIQTAPFALRDNPGALKIPELDALLNGVEECLQTPSDTARFIALAAEIKRSAASNSSIEEQISVEELATAAEGLAGLSPSAANRRLLAMRQSIEEAYGKAQQDRELKQLLASWASLLKAAAGRDRAAREQASQELDDRTLKLEENRAVDYEKFAKARGLEAAFRREFGDASFRHIESCRRVSQVEKQIAQASAKFLRELRETLPPGIPLDQARPNHVATATGLAWPRPEDPEPFSTGPADRGPPPTFTPNSLGLTPLRLGSTPPIRNAFAPENRRTAQFVDSALRGELIERANRLILNPRLPEPRRAFLRNYLALLAQYRIPMQDSDPEFDFLLDNLEEIYPRGPVPPG